MSVAPFERGLCPAWKSVRHGKISWDEKTVVSIKKRPSETTNHNQPAKKPCLSTTRVTGEVEKKPKGKKEADKGAKTAKAVAPKASFKRPGAKAVAKKRNDTMIEPDLNPASPFYGEYSLAFIPKSAWPSLQRTHRGVHSYTVEYKGALLDVLLRSAAFYVKRAVKEGRSGSVAFSKWGGPEQAWKIALRLAGVPNEED
ncbi:unnamed protein product [Effrenium voratum]|nr:unnamed protein product [Effrenium voratum]